MSVNVPNGYKQTKVGVIPEEWDFVMLKDITFKITDGTHKTPKYTTDGVVFMSAKNIIGSNLNFKDIKYIGQEEHEELQKRCFPESEDILLTKSGSLGSAVVIPKLEFEFSIFESLALLKINKTICSPHYLNQYLNSDYSQRYFDAITTGLAVKHLHLVDLRKTKIPLPPLKEQQKIAQIFTTWDKTISKQEALIAEKKELKKGLMQKLLSGEVRFEGFDGEWEKVKLGDIFAERSKRYKSLATEEIEIYSELLSVGVNTGVTKRSENDAKDNSSSDKSNYKILNKNDIAYNTMRMWQGASGVSSMNGIVSPAYTIVYLKKDYCIEFFGLLFKMHRVVFDFYRYSQGLTSDTWNLKYPHFSEVKVKIPTSKQEQQKIAQLLTIADKEIELLKEELEALKEQKRGLMQRLLTGEVRVKIDGGEIK